jgi:hypothetical protein
MTGHHRHPLDRLRADPPPGLDDRDWRDAYFETDGSDILEGLDATALYDGDGDLYGLRIGRLTLSEAQIKLMLDPAHFARIRTMDPMTLDTARQDWLASMDDDRDGQ